MKIGMGQVFRGRKTMETSNLKILTLWGSFWGHFTPFGTKIGGKNKNLTIFQDKKPLINSEL